MKPIPCLLSYLCVWVGGWVGGFISFLIKSRYKIFENYDYGCGKKKSNIVFHYHLHLYHVNDIMVLIFLF